MRDDKLGAMKCIHLDTKKNNLETYFNKRKLYHLYVQPKFNGIRALWYHGDGLYTRNNNLITSVPQIVARLKVYFPDTDLDGELYHPTMHFNEINGAARRIKSTSNSLKLEYHVFDRLDSDMTQQNRLHLNNIDLVELHEDPFIKEAPFIQTTPGHLNYTLRSYLAKRFEGIVVRAPDPFYREGRHVGNIWAIKPVYEIEAMFLGFLPPGEDTSLHQSTFGSLLLKLPGNGRTFSCSGISEDERERLWNDPPVEGTWITVKFGAWSSDHPDKAVPLFPRFKCIRWDK